MGNFNNCNAKSSRHLLKNQQAYDEAVRLFKMLSLDHNTLTGMKQVQMPAAALHLRPKVV
jgi:hypothetical protein